MRYFLLCFSLLALISCRPENTNQTATTPSTPSTTDTAPQTATNSEVVDVTATRDPEVAPERAEVCETISSAQVQKIMAWNGMNVAVTPGKQRRGITGTSCAYESAAGEKIAMRLNWVEAGAVQATESLQNQYQALLNPKEQQGFQYEEMPNLGTQALFGKMEYRGDMLYHLKIRYGNDMDVSVEMVTTNRNEGDLKLKMLQLASLL